MSVRWLLLGAVAVISLIVLCADSFGLVPVLIGTAVGMFVHPPHVAPITDDELYSWLEQGA